MTDDYKKLWALNDQWCQLMLENKENTPEVEQIWDEMDTIWKRLSPEEQQAARILYIDQCK